MVWLVTIIQIFRRNYVACFYKQICEKLIHAFSNSIEYCLLVLISNILIISFFMLRNIYFVTTIKIQKLYCFQYWFYCLAFKRKLFISQGCKAKSVAIFWNQMRQIKKRRMMMGCHKLSITIKRLTENVCYNYNLVYKCNSNSNSIKCDRLKSK